MAILTAVLAWITNRGGAYLLIVSALLATAVLIAFPLYFQRANASFATHSIAVDQVAAELRAWALWHWGRAVIATASFILAVIALPYGRYERKVTRVEPSIRAERASRI
jgi:hypothetical protein